jgi:hypothetical protein
MREPVTTICSISVSCATTGAVAETAAASSVKRTAREITLLLAISFSDESKNRLGYGAAQDSNKCLGIAIIDASKQQKSEFVGNP